MSHQVIIGDCLTSLRPMASESVNCCVTSPPYFGLRDYGHDGQMGLESSPEEYVAKMVEVFREVRRVLRDDGTLWLNIGDSYNGYIANQRGTGLESKRQQSRKYIEPGSGLRTSTLKNKDLIGIPWMLAFALRADGWYLRQDIIWSKPNPMPESVTDRCTKAHEYIFLLSKSARYWYDNTAIAEESIYKAGEGGHQRFGAPGGKAEKEYGQQVSGEIWNSSGTRNKRSVWTIATKPYAGAHFATFPPELIRPCIIAGCPQEGTVIDPFAGSGTTGQVAIETGRSVILLELNPEYEPLINKRLRNAAHQVKMLFPA